MKELKAGMNVIIETTNMSELEITDLFEKLDENSNGLIEYSEFMTAYMTKELTMHSKNLRLAFDALDTDNNDRLDMIELEQGLKAQKCFNTKLFCDKLML